VQPPEIWAWIYPELPGELRSCVAKCRKRLGLPSAPVKGNHLVSGELFAQWILENQLTQLGYEAEAVTHCQICLNALLQSGQPGFVDRGDASPEQRKAVGQVGKHRAAPEVKRLVQQRRRGSRVSRQTPAGLRRQRGESLPI